MRDYVEDFWSFSHALQETFGAMAKTEKVFYILEQVRLCLDRKDFIRSGPHFLTLHLGLLSCCTLHGVVDVVNCWRLGS